MAASRARPIVTLILVQLASLCFAAFPPSPPPAVPPCYSELLSPIMADDYAAEESVSDGEVDMGSSDLELMVDNGDTQIIGIMIPGLQLPRGALIHSAELVFMVDEVDKDGGELSVEIHGERSATPAFLSETSYDISSRTQTSSSITWAVPSGVPVGDRVASSDVSNIVQEIVDLDAWDYGHAMVFIIQHVSGSGVRVYEADKKLDDDTETPGLRIVWADPATSSCDFPPRPPAYPPTPALPPVLPFPPAAPPGPCLPQSASQDNYGLTLNSPPVAMSANNLGGLGPTQSDPPYIQFDNVGTKTVGGVSTSINLRVENTSTYFDNPRTKTNGRNGFYGRIVVGWGRSVDLRFSFVDVSGDPVTLDDGFFLELYDLDGSDSGGQLRETVGTCDATTMYLHEDTNLQQSAVLEDDLAKANGVPVQDCYVVSTTSGTNVGPYPFHPYVGMPEIQLRHSVSFLFENTATFDMRFDATYTSSPIDGSNARSYYFSLTPAIARASVSCGEAPSPPPASGLSPAPPPFSPAECEQWCNVWTCGDASCSGCQVCFDVRAGTVCESWCTEYSCTHEMCAGCSQCTPAAIANRCYNWCNVYVCDLHVTGCKGCSLCQSPHMWCEGWCNAHTENNKYCAGC